MLSSIYTQVRVDQCRRRRSSKEKSSQVQTLYFVDFSGVYLRALDTKPFFFCRLAARLASPPPSVSLHTSDVPLKFHFSLDLRVPKAGGWLNNVLENCSVCAPRGTEKIRGLRHRSPANHRRPRTSSTGISPPHCESLAIICPPRGLVASEMPTTHGVQDTGLNTQQSKAATQEPNSVTIQISRVAQSRPAFVA